MSASVNRLNPERSCSAFPLALRAQTELDVLRTVDDDRARGRKIEVHEVLPAHHRVRDLHAVEDRLDMVHVEIPPKRLRELRAEHDDAPRGRILEPDEHGVPIRVEKVDGRGIERGREEVEALLLGDLLELGLPVPRRGGGAIELVERHSVPQRSVFDPEVHVPLLVKTPHQKEGKRITAPAQVIDILPTILDIIGSDDPLTERSLLGGVVTPAFIFWENKQVVRTQQWKLIRKRDGGRSKLFQIELDPRERNNLASERPEVLRELNNLIETKLLELGLTSQQLEEITSEAVEQMKALGYME